MRIFFDNYKLTDECKDDQSRDTPSQHTFLTHHKFFFNFTKKVFCLFIFLEL